jgi:DNA-binding response OmpR family regulator
MMPKMDGYELCRKLKTDERTSHIPVILLTARAGGESKVEGLETGADDYIIKPFDARELQVRVKNLIEQRRKLRERFRKEITLQPKDIAITSMDEQFLKKSMDVVEQNLSDPEFSTEMFAKKVAMSRAQMNRKLRALTGQSTHEFIRAYRLMRAAQLLQHRAGTVSEICYDVGFNSLSHFAKAFREQFGQSPSEFAASHAAEES